MRTLSLKVLTQTELVKVETDVRTFGELKKEKAIVELGIDWKSAKLIDRASKASFEMDDAVLPHTNAIMFVMPTKSKAGAYSYWEAKKKIKAMKESGVEIPFNYTQASTDKMNEFLAAVESKDDSAPVVEKTESSDVEEVLVNDTIYLKPGKYMVIIEAPTEAIVPPTVELHLVDSTTLEDLDAEAKELKRILNGK